MKLGLLVGYVKEEIALLSHVGFQSCELLIFPDSPLAAGRGAKADDWKRVREEFDALGIEVSAVGSYTNNISPNLNERESDLAHLETLFDIAPIMGTDVVATFAGRDPDLEVADNIPEFKKVFAPLTKRAEDRGIRIAIENCPMWYGCPQRSTNIAYTPEAWTLMFDAVNSPNLGLEFDPSHLICLHIDYMRALREFAHKVIHVHAKDGEILPEAVQRYGVHDFRAWRHRMPGLGQCDWGRFIGTLREIGYKGNLDIEGRHDAIYQGADEVLGLEIGAAHLRTWLPKIK
jgi:sugar phosphate isomerase/epimerase